ncbi:Uncharacterised protein [Mycobacteroides abscessus subsp. abscessus]|nr:Uncharacterised protein [Mycobacteroides abscessus subsp. abscessus]
MATSRVRMSYNFRPPPFSCTTESTPATTCPQRIFRCVCRGWICVQNFCQTSNVCLVHVLGNHSRRRRGRARRVVGSRALWRADDAADRRADVRGRRTVEDRPGRDHRALRVRSRQRRLSNAAGYQPDSRRARGRLRLRDRRSAPRPRRFPGGSARAGDAGQIRR